MTAHLRRRQVAVTVAGAVAAAAVRLPHMIWASILRVRPCQSINDRQSATPTYLGSALFDAPANARSGQLNTLESVPVRS